MPDSIVLIKIFSCFRQRPLFPAEGDFVTELIKKSGYNIVRKQKEDIENVCNQDYEREFYK